MLEDKEPSGYLFATKDDGGYSLNYSGELTQTSVGKRDFIGIHKEFFKTAGDVWICSKHSESDLLGYVVGFNIDTEEASLEITLKSARGKVRIFKTIDAAFDFLLSCGYSHAVINYG